MKLKYCAKVSIVWKIIDIIAILSFKSEVELNVLRICTETKFKYAGTCHLKGCSRCISTKSGQGSLKRSPLVQNSEGHIRFEARSRGGGGNSAGLWWLKRVCGRRAREPNDGHVEESQQRLWEAEGSAHCHASSVWFECFFQNFEVWRKHKPHRLTQCFFPSGWIMSSFTFSGTFSLQMRDNNDDLFGRTTLIWCHFGKQRRGRLISEGSDLTFSAGFFCR